MGLINFKPLPKKGRPTVTGVWKGRCRQAERPLRATGRTIMVRTTCLITLIATVAWNSQRVRDGNVYSVSPPGRILGCLNRSSPSGHTYRLSLTQLQLDWTPMISTRKINLPSNQKCYDESETSFGKLSSRRIQIFHVYFCATNIWPFIFENRWKWGPNKNRHGRFEFASTSSFRWVSGFGRSPYGSLGN